jgi:hypothetical protein
MATPKRTRATSTTTRSKKTAAPKAMETTTQGNVEEIIRFRAYQLFEQRGRNHGFDKEDWLRAEVEITAPNGQSA